jgi:hypothetical protein
MRHATLRSSTAVVVIAAAVTTVAGLGVAVDLGAGPAGAATSGPTAARDAAHGDVRLPSDPTVQQVQSAAAADIGNRVTALDGAAGKVQSATDLGADQATLLHPLQADVPALQQLGQKIAADTTVATALADYAQIFSGYRVYALVLPVTALVRVDDHITDTAGPRLTAVSAKIAARETSANQGQVQPLLADLAQQVSAATAAVNGQPATLMTDTPAQWNADHGLLGPAWSAGKAARGDVAAARSDARQAAAAAGIRAGQRKGADGGTTSAPSTGTTGSGSTPST